MMVIINNSSNHNNDNNNIIIIIIIIITITIINIHSSEQPVVVCVLHQPASCVLHVFSSAHDWSL